MDRKELSFRLAARAAAGAGCWPALADGARPCRWRRGAGLLGAHTLSFTLNGQVWVCARYCRWYRRDPAALERFLRAVAAELRGLPWLREAVCIGSLGRRRRGARRSRRPRPAPAVPARRRWPGCASTCCCCACAPGPCSAASRSTSMPTSGPSGCAASTSASGCWSCSTATAGWRALYPRRRRPLAVIETAPHLLGLLAGRAPGRARARHRRHRASPTGSTSPSPAAARRASRRAAPTSSATRAARPGARCATSPARW